MRWIFMVGGWVIHKNKEKGENETKGWWREKRDNRKNNQIKEGVVWHHAINRFESSLKYLGTASPSEGDPDNDSSQRFDLSS